MYSPKPRLWESLPDKHLVSLPKKYKEKGERQMGKELLNERGLKPDIKQLKSVDLIWIWFKQANSIENMFMNHLDSCMLNPPANAGDRRDVGSIPGGREDPLEGRSPRGGHGNPLQYSCLENLMDRGGWQATVHRVTQSGTQLKWLSKHTDWDISRWNNRLLEICFKIT